MNVFYLDPGLASDHGHHAASCRAFREGFERCKLNVRVFAHERALPAILTELDATPLFRFSTYWRDSDQLAAWFRSVELARSEMVRDLQRLPPLQTDDLLFFNSISAPHLLGLADWMATSPTDKRPYIVVEFGHDPGVDSLEWPPLGRYRMRDPRIDSRAAVYRTASIRLIEICGGRVFFVTFESYCSALFSALIGSPVATLPSLICGKATRLSRRTREVTLSALGSQRREKGYHLLPEITRELFVSYPRLNLLVHNSDPTWMQEAHDNVLNCTKSFENIKIVDRPAGKTTWSQLLRNSDVVLCPYEPGRYHASYSAVAAEAVANGIPIVGPRYTSIDRLIQRYPGCGDTFDEWSPSSIARATSAVLLNLPLYSTKATQASISWNEDNGPDRAVSSLLEMLKLSSNVRSEATMQGNVCTIIP